MVTSGHHSVIFGGGMVGSSLTIANLVVERLRDGNIRTTGNTKV